MIFVRTSTKPPENHFFFRKIDFWYSKTSPSPYNEWNDVRTRKISEIETAIDMLERQKSHSVRPLGIEPRTSDLSGQRSTTELRAQCLDKSQTTMTNAQ